MSAFKTHPYGSHMDAPCIDVRLLQNIASDGNDIKTPPMLIHAIITRIQKECVESKGPQLGQSCPETRLIWFLTVRLGLGVQSNNILETNKLQMRVPLEIGK